jgi:subtilisin family serine protease
MLANEPMVSYPLDLVNLAPLMERTAGRPEITVGLIDGPVAADHSDLTAGNIRHVVKAPREAATVTHTSARAHGTYVAGILSGRRGSAAPSICPGCTLLVRAMFLEVTAGADMPRATPNDLATAIVDCLDAGARVLNLSVAVAQLSPNREHKLEEALNRAASRRVIVVAAAGNQSTLGSSAVTRHPWVIPVVACDSRGRPLATSNLGSSIGRRGLMAPGDQITSLGADGQPVTSGGTSAAAPFVTGAVALLWSLFPEVSAAEVKSLVTRPNVRRATVVPPVLDAWAAYQMVVNRNG